MQLSLFFCRFLHFFEFFFVANTKFIPLDINESFVCLGDFFVEVRDSFEDVIDVLSVEVLGLVDARENGGDAFAWLFFPLLKYFKEVIHISTLHIDKIDLSNFRPDIYNKIAQLHLIKSPSAYDTFCTISTIS